MGICARKSHRFLTSWDKPLPSLPMTIAAGDLKSARIFGFAAAVYADDPDVVFP
jgi:hypothetical protein